MGCACLPQQRNGDGEAGSSLVLSTTEVVVLESLLGDRWSLQCLSSHGSRAHLPQVHSRIFLSKACFLETIVAISGRPQYIANTATVPLFGDMSQRLYISVGLTSALITSPLCWKKCSGPPQCSPEEVRPLLVWPRPFAAFGEGGSKRRVLAHSC